MSVSGTIFILILTFLLGVNACGWVFLPEKFPFNVYELAGWLLAIAALISWEIAR